MGLRPILCEASHRQAFIFFFFFNDTATTEIYTLSLHDALPISLHLRGYRDAGASRGFARAGAAQDARPHDLACAPRSEEHTSELQSRLHLVCRLLLEKKKKKHKTDTIIHPILFSLVYI